MKERKKESGPQVKSKLIGCTFYGVWFFIFPRKKKLEQRSLFEFLENSFFPQLATESTCDSQGNQQTKKILSPWQRDPHSQRHGKHALGENKRGPGGTEYWKRNVLI